MRLRTRLRIWRIERARRRAPWPAPLSEARTPVNWSLLFRPPSWKLLDDPTSGGRFPDERRAAREAVDELAVDLRKLAEH